MLTGYWRWAIIQDGSVPTLMVQITEGEDDTLVAASEVEDWLWYGMGGADRPFPMRRMSRP